MESPERMVRVFGLLTLDSKVWEDKDSFPFGHIVVYWTPIITSLSPRGEEFVWLRPNLVNRGFRGDPDRLPEGFSWKDPFSYFKNGHVLPGRVFEETKYKQQFLKQPSLFGILYRNLESDSERVLEELFAEGKTDKWAYTFYPDDFRIHHPNAHNCVTWSVELLNSSGLIPEDHKIPCPYNGKVKMFLQELRYRDDYKDAEGARLT